MLCHCECVCTYESVSLFPGLSMWALGHVAYSKTLQGSSGHQSCWQHGGCADTKTTAVVLTVRCIIPGRQGCQMAACVCSLRQDADGVTTCELPVMAGSGGMWCQQVSPGMMPWHFIPHPDLSLQRYTWP